MENKIKTNDVVTDKWRKIRMKSIGRQNFRTVKGGEKIKALTIRKRAIKDGYKFAKEES